MLATIIERKSVTTPISINSKVVLLNNSIVTKREREVLQKLSEGLTVKGIARVLCVSPHTVLSHKKNLMEKFDAKNAIDLVVKAIRIGLIVV